MRARYAHEILRVYARPRRLLTCGVRHPLAALDDLFYAAARRLVLAHPQTQPPALLAAMEASRLVLVDREAEDQRQRRPRVGSNEGSALVAGMDFRRCAHEVIPAW